MSEQYIILCLQDSDPYDEPKNNKTYVQVSRKRYNYADAEKRSEQIAPSRKPVFVKVPSVPLDEDGYPA